MFCRLQNVIEGKNSTTELKGGFGVGVGPGARREGGFLPCLRVNLSVLSTRPRNKNFCIGLGALGFQKRRGGMSCETICESIVLVAIRVSWSGLRALSTRLRG